MAWFVDGSTKRGLKMLPGLKVAPFYALFPVLGWARFFLAGFLSAFFSGGLRSLISSGEYMVPRHLAAPQLQAASSSPPS
jgi:hypothetical protein